MPEFSDLMVVDFSDLAQGCKTYDEFIEKMKDVSETELNYLEIAICGGLLFSWADYIPDFQNMQSGKWYYRMKCGKLYI